MLFDIVSYIICEGTTKRRRECGACEDELGCVRGAHDIGCTASAMKGATQVSQGQKRYFQKVWRFGFLMLTFIYAMYMFCHTI